MSQLDDIQRAAQEQFGRQSHRYGRGHILENIEDVRAAIDPLDLKPGMKALDVATGGGHTGIYLASLGCDVTLADIAEPMLQRAAAAADALGYKVKTELHAAENMPYAHSCFDIVTCRVAPHHFSSPEAFIAETARVLAPGGWFVLIDGTVEDGQLEAEEWAHQLEKLRDPSHNRLLTPGQWTRLCKSNGLNVTRTVVTPFKQPDLQWYFETAATPLANRVRVRELIANAPDSARRLFRLGEENGKIVWWWQRLTLVARKQTI
ncbi:MAG: class I SAM-dependent methyltransferase [Verrucomicrobia subdivision 3 bacterium]|nr:class I SAM-dependent methyltransferase [Limisphaerales bacterium]